MGETFLNRVVLLVISSEGVFLIRTPLLTHLILDVLLIILISFQNKLQVVFVSELGTICMNKMAKE